MRAAWKVFVPAVSAVLVSFGGAEQEADSPVGRWYDPRGVRMELREDGTALIQAVAQGRDGGVEIQDEMNARWSPAILLEMREESHGVAWRGDELIWELRRGDPMRLARVEGEDWPAVDAQAGREMSQARIAANEASAAACLRSIVTAEEILFNHDADRNGVRDYWAGDLFGLYSLSDTGAAGGESVRLTQDHNLAYADAAPLRGEARGARVYALEPPDEPEPNSGYLYRVVRDAEAPWGPGGVGSSTEFAFVAYPAEYGVTGVHTLIVDQEGRVWRADRRGDAITAFPSLDELMRDWELVE